MEKYFFILLLLSTFSCTPDDPDDTIDIPTDQPVQVWITSGDGINLLYNKGLDFAPAKDERFPVIQVDTTQLFQPIEGFGYTLTGGSAMLLHQMAPAERAALLEEFFGNDANSIGVSYLRISIGASDLDPVVFSYNDLPSGQTDPDLTQFNLSRDTLFLIPVLKEILAINPNIRLLGSPWSPPVWMKTNESSIGGNLKLQHYETYARYFVKYIQAMAGHGIVIDAITPQNEPLHGGNNPSMVMSAAQQKDFIKNHLGPAFEGAGLTTKIIIWDHNCDNPGYPIEVMDDPAAKAYVHGSAFHMYGGDAGALSTVYNAHPDKALYFTEQWTSAAGNFSDDLEWHLKNIMIGTLRNWSRVVLEWNLANDPGFGPHTPGGCTQCKGAVTIDGSSATKNVSFYIVAQLSKFVPPGSVRVGSNTVSLLPNAAFRTPEGKTVLVVLNEKNDLQTFNINLGSQWVTASLQGNSAGTFVW